MTSLKTRKCYSSAPTANRRQGTRRRCARSLALASAVLAAASSAARAQIAALDKGHNLLVTNGLQIWGADSNTNDTFDYPTMAAANINGVFWGFPAQGGSDMSKLAPGNKWGKWTDWRYNPGVVDANHALTGTEPDHVNDLISLQAGDEENQTDEESGSGSLTRQWIANERTAGPGGTEKFPNTLIYTNSFFINSDAGFADF